MIEEIDGNILVLGAGGFIGANLFRTLIAERDDVFGSVSKVGEWRLDGTPKDHIYVCDLCNSDALISVLAKVKPKTIFNCAAHGAYSWQFDSERMYETNFLLPSHILEWAQGYEGVSYIHAGSSSEYGTNSAGPTEDSPLFPDSPYAVSKAAASHIIHYYGKEEGINCCNLRLYSVYGPYEDPQRLIPQVVINGVEGRYPPFVSPDVSRSFVYVGDVVDAFVAAAVKLTPDYYGEAFNIGTGDITTIEDVARFAGWFFGIEGEPDYSMPNRAWDRVDWYSNPTKAREVLGWSSEAYLHNGIAATAAWYNGLSDREAYINSSTRSLNGK